MKLATYESLGEAEKAARLRSNLDRNILIYVCEWSTSASIWQKGRMFTACQRKETKGVPGSFRALTAYQAGEWTFRQVEYDCETGELLRDGHSGGRVIRDGKIGESIGQKVSS